LKPTTNSKGICMKTIFRILALALPTKSVDTLIAILGDFAKQLKAAEDQQRAKAADLRFEASVKLTEAGDADAKADLAARVAGNLFAN
jgi:hypothetical protein